LFKIRFKMILYSEYHQIIYGKNGFVETFKNLARYGSENNFVRSLR